MTQDQEKYLKKAARVAQKSKCQRAKTGAVIVKNRRILVEAFNRIYPENDFCQKHGCLRDKLKLGLGKEAEKCRSLHAEAAAVTQAAKKGINLKGASAYLTFQPCINCAKLFYAAGIKKVYYLDRHADQTGAVFLKKMGVLCQQLKIKKDDSQKRLRDTTGQ